MKKNRKKNRRKNRRKKGKGNACHLRPPSTRVGVLGLLDTHRQAKLSPPQFAVLADSDREQMGSTVVELQHCTCCAGKRETQQSGGGVCG